ncbi:MAG: hypothetical protein ACOCSJ_00725 [Candidatus Natronoplasma sp.]
MTKWILSLSSVERGVTLLLTALIIVTILVFFYFHRVRKNSNLYDLASKKRKDLDRVENRPNPFRERYQNIDNDRTSDDIILQRYKGKGEQIQQVFKNLTGSDECIENLMIKKISKKGEGLTGVFLVGDPQKRLVLKDLKHEFVAKKELEKKEIKELDLSEIEFRDSPRESREFLVDEYDDIYLKTKDDIKKICSKNVKKKEIVVKAKKWIKVLAQKEKMSLEIDEFYESNGTFKVGISEKKEDRSHRFIIDENGVIHEYTNENLDNTDSSSDDDFTSDSGYSKLPFSHGIEVELLVVKEDWDWIEGEQMAIVFEEILDDAQKKIANIKNQADPLVRKKWSGITEIKEDHRGYEAVHVRYDCKGEKRCYSVLGKDSHVALKTNILEIQTPPCEYLEELKWWTYNIYRIAHQVVNELDIEANLISLGINPVQKYSEGVSFGEHHHIEIEDYEIRRKVYNLYRYLEPHLISLTATSPFSNGRCPNYVLNDQGSLAITDPSHTMRLKKNVEQFRLPPHLPPGRGEKYFEKNLITDSDSVRMVDIYPFTRFETIETRIFDTQLSTIDRISIAVLLQALALSVKREAKEIEITDIGDDLLKKNRNEAIENGLLGRFCQPRTDKEKDDLFEQGDVRYFYESWRKIIYQLWPYFEKLGLEDSCAVTNLILRLYSCNELSVEPPITPAQLIVLRSSEESPRSDRFKNMLNYIKESSSKAAADMMHDLWPDDIDLKNIDLDEIDGL